MKNITAIVNGVSEKVRSAFKEQRIFKEIDAAEINAKEDLAVAEMELKELACQCSDDDAQTIVQKISERILQVDAAKATLAHLQAIRDYLNKDEEE